MEKEYKWMVRVDCKTFNQASYIEDALNGFCMQETTFPFVCTIIDDASTDGEQDVIRRYLEEHFDLGNKSVVRNEETEDYTLTFTRHKTNTNCYFAVLYLKYNHYSIKKTKMPYIAEWHENCKYIAYCEGDDFWINSNMLKTLVSFLEINDDYSCAFGNRIVSDDKGKELDITKFTADLTIHDIMEGRNPGLRNLLLRHVVLNVELVTTRYCDLIIYYKCAVCGKMKYIDVDFAVYRYTGNGVCSQLAGKDAIYAQYYHYYLFHKDTGFKYQKEYVSYQISRLLSNLFNPRFMLYSLILMEKFHAPSPKRYLWYGECTVQKIVKKMTK